MPKLIGAFEARNDERFFAHFDPNEPFLPVEELWKAWGLESRRPAAWKT
jgi:hypothetical protein